MTSNLFHLYADPHGALMALSGRVPFPNRLLDYIEHLHKQEGEVTRNIGTLIANAAGRDKSEWKLGK